MTIFLPTNRCIHENIVTLKKLEGSLSVLDKGFVRIVDTMGDDSAIVQAARVSYGEGTKTVSEDKGLIRYLMRNRHTSPFEMCEIKLHIKAPIFVMRQWLRHRTANVNEYSGRYSEIMSEFYLPEANRLQKQSTNNKQGSEGTLDKETAEYIRDTMHTEQMAAYETYRNTYLASDLARELARINLPPSAYTQCYWKIDLHNLLHFIKLRHDSHAQYEIRVYAEAIADIVKLWCPLAFEAFEDYVLNASSVSDPMKQLMVWFATQIFPKGGFENTNVFWEKGITEYEMSYQKEFSKSEKREIIASLRNIYGE